MKKMFKKAHEMAREIKREYPEVDYRTQFGICLSYLHKNEEAEEMASIELYESNRFRCWAAEVTGTDPKYGLARTFLDPSETWGHYKTYELEDGKYYNYLNDKKQHFVKVVNGKIVKMTKSEMAKEVA